MTKLTQMSLDEEGGAGRRRIHLREITGGGELPLETVGQDLRAARQRRGDDLATVSKALKIRKDHLEALEEDRIDSLPGKTYAIGFVRTYAQHLGLDPNAFVERFKQEISGRADEHPTQPVTPVDDEEQRRLPQGWRLIGGVLVLLLAYGAWHLLASDRNGGQAVPEPPDVAIAPRPAPPPTPVETAPAPAIDATGAPSATDAAATPQPEAATPSPAAEAAPAVLPAGKVYGEQNRNARVVLRARSATHITVRGKDGTTFINRNLLAGDIYQVPNFTGLTLSTSNGGAVEVDLDGLAMGNAGASDQETQDLPLDPQSIVDHFGNRRPG